MVFPGRYSNLSEIASFVLSAAHEADLDAFACYAVETAVDEACSNIIEHAYQGEGRGEIECTCQVTPDQLVITLRDQGIPFDPSEVQTPDPTVGLEDHPGHGLGLYFIRQWMDEVHFQFSEEKGNILTLVKRKGRQL